VACDAEQLYGHVQRHRAISMGRSRKLLSHDFGEYEVTLHTPATPDVTVMAAIFSYYSATFEMNRYSVDRLWEE
jgi:hypothetical protein